MIPAKKSRTSISGEATDFDDCDQIPMSQMAELYVAIKHIVQEGKEALMCMNMRQTDDYCQHTTLADFLSGRGAKTELCFIAI